MLKQDNKIGPEINLVKIPANTTFTFDFDKNTPWIQNILNELNEHASDIDPTELENKTHFHLSGHFEKKNRADLGEYVLAEGLISTTYYTECVRTLKPMTVNLEIPYKICFLDQSLEESDMVKDTDEIWTDNQIYEIFYFTKRTVPFQEMVHELVFLNYDQYPVLDADSPLQGAISSDE
jgi:uncharacterized metal-binding protein YceD (DUF177 family)